jgi:hypothetical protein
LLFALAAVLLLLMDLDRVQEGLINVGQKALLDLQRQLAAPMP